MAAEDDDRDRARALALDAVKLAPTLVPAVDLAARLLGEAGELRRASRMIEKAWQANPHPDLAEAYAHLRPGDSARERLARVQSLALKAAGHVESSLAVGRAALDAQEFAVARAALRPLLKEPTQRVAALMAEIEERESGDEGRAREWMARALRAPRDPKWTADGIVSERWMPVSPASGRLDAFEWKVPVAEIADEREVIESGETEPAAPRTEPAARDAERPKSIAAPTPLSPLPPEAMAPRATLPASRPAVPAQSSRVEAVVPLVHAPDDPGPEAAPDQDPAAEAPSAARGLRLFR
jgi:HemY protein